jgi:hypothetical protein
MSTSPRIPVLADAGQAEAHLRAMIDPDHLSSPTVLVVGCDGGARPTSHVEVVDCDLDAAPSECAEVLDRLLYRMEDGPPVMGLALGLTRPGGEQVQAYDRTWFRAFHRICHQRGLTPYGVYTVTRTGARPVHLDDAA